MEKVTNDNGDLRSVVSAGRAYTPYPQMRRDLTPFCPESFSKAVLQNPSPIQWKGKIKAGATRPDEIAAKSLSHILIHELAHWYGSIKLDKKLISTGLDYPGSSHRRLQLKC